MAGFQDFIREYSEGWSFVAIRATADSVAKRLAGQPDVSEYEENAGIQPMTRDEQTGLSLDSNEKPVSLTTSRTERTCCLVQLRSSEWCLVFRTIHWCELQDTNWVKDTAARLSGELATSALACCGGHGLLATRYEAGEQVEESVGYNPKKLASQLKSLKIEVPMCFIGGSPPTLFADDKVSGTILRHDRFVVRVT